MPIFPNVITISNIARDFTPAEMDCMMSFKDKVRDNGSNTEDIPFRMIPAMAAGLAYHLSVKLEGVDMQRIMGLKAAYEETWQQAADEDREKASVRWVPRNMFYYR